MLHNYLILATAIVWGFLINTLPQNVIATACTYFLHIPAMAMFYVFPVQRFSPSVTEVVSKGQRYLSGIKCLIFWREKKKNQFLNVSLHKEICSYKPFVNDAPFLRKRVVRAL